MPTSATTAPVNATGSRCTSSDREPVPDPRRTMTLPERVRARVRVDANGCWIWQGVRNQWDDDFVRNKPGRRPLSVGVHRMIYEDADGPIPDGRQIDHVHGETGPGGIGAEVTRCHP
jgi:hypothetical protein